MNLKGDKSGKWFIYSRDEHPDGDYPQFPCDECGYLSSQNELDKTWDWSGPHCKNCGNTGLNMFSSIQARASVVNGKGAIEYGMKKLVESYEKIIKGW